MSLDLTQSAKHDTITSQIALTSFGRRSAERADILRDLRGKSGVYLFRDARDVVIYVGMSNDLARRLATWLKPPRGKRGRKQRRIMKTVVSIEPRVLASAAEARQTEIELIQSLRPAGNLDGKQWFLYPAIGMHQPDPRTLEMCWTTFPDDCVERFQLFGVWRGLADTRAAFDQLVMLLEMLGHPAESSPLIAAPRFTARRTVRQIPPKVVAALSEYLSGRSSDLLGALALELLEKPQARAKATVVDEALGVLRAFWKTHLRPLCERLASESQGSGPKTFVSQRERDPLFARGRGLVTRSEQRTAEL